jgi:hypothetical protein
VHFSGLVDFAGQFQNTFRGRCFTGIHVSEDAYVSVFA